MKFNKVEDDLRKFTVNHIDDVSKCLEVFIKKIEESARGHDYDKLQTIPEYQEYIDSGFNTDWFDGHVKANRHHLKNRVHEDVNLIDVLDMISDCVAAGYVRSGEFYDVTIDKDTLMLAFNNTVKILINEVKNG